MCYECFDIHKSLPVFSLHKHTQTLNVVNQKCNIHNDELIKYHCSDCNIPLCKICKSTNHLVHNKEYIKTYCEEKLTEIIIDKYLPYENFEQFNSKLYLLNENTIDSIYKQATNMVDLIQTTINSLEQTKKDIFHKAKSLEDEIKLHLKIYSKIYERFYKEIQKLTKDDYKNLNFFSKLKKIKLLPILKQNVNDELKSKLKLLKETVAKINEDKENHINMKNNSFLNYYSNIKISKSLRTKINFNVNNNAQIKNLINLKDTNIASYYKDGIISIWNSNDNFSFDIIKLNTDNVTSIIELNYGNLVSGHGDGTLKIWDKNNNYNLIKSITINHIPIEELKKRNPTNVPSYYVSSVIQIDDNIIACFSYRYNYNYPRSHIYCVCLVNLTDDKYFSDNNKTYIDVGYSLVNSLIILQDKRLAFPSEYNIQIWRINNGTFTDSQILENSNITNCLIELKNGFLASSSENDIKIWDLTKFSVPTNNFNNNDQVIIQNKIPIPNHLIMTLLGKSKISALVELKDNLLMSAHTDTSLCIWNLIKNNLVTTINSNPSPINCMILLQDGKLASISDDKEIKIWD